MEQERNESMEIPADFDALLQSSKVYQSAFDRKVEKALQTARARWEREQEAAQTEQETRLQQEAMTRAEQALADRTAEQDRREAQLELRLRQADVAQQLAEIGLPTRFAPWLTGDTPEDSQARVAAFQAAFQQGVDTAVVQRMTGAAPAEPAPSAGYDRSDLQTMTPREINAHWAEIQNTLKGSV